MKKLFILLPILALSFVACERVENKPKSNGSPKTVDVDNTGLNVRDQNFNTVTPGDQSENEIDRGITQNIRRAIIEDELISNNGKNIKIITINGVVTLRGPVNDPVEKAKIEKIVAKVQNIKRVDNQLEVKR